MSYKAACGGTVLGVASNSNHLIILAGSPVLPFYKALGSVAILSVNVITWTEGRLTLDPACILQEGDHPFIKHKSFCGYLPICVGYPVFLKNYSRWSVEF